MRERHACTAGFGRYRPRVTPGTRGTVHTYFLRRQRAHGLCLIDPLRLAYTQKLVRARCSTWTNTYPGVARVRTYVCRVDNELARLSTR